MFRYILIYVIFTFSIVIVSGLELGEPCKVGGKNGECVSINKCLSAKENYIKTGKTPPICSHGQDIIVCCENEETTTASRPNNSGAGLMVEPPANLCGPITSLSAPEAGQTAWNKCLEYQEKLLRPCKDVLLVEGKARINQCTRDTLALTLQSDIAYEGELPHMVLLGYGGREINSTIWSCEGVIISERFVLTLAACTNHPELGRVRYIRTNVLRISDPADPSDVYQIKTTRRHPSYEAPKPQNDIALLETDKDITLYSLVIPACLDVGNLPSYERALATGWDRLFKKDAELQKRYLTEAPPSGCQEYRPHYDEKIQMCYVNGKNNHYAFDRVLQIEHIRCMYVVIGLENRRSGQTLGIPFTRVAAFIPWIESIVWP